MVSDPTVMEDYQDLFSLTLLVGKEIDCRADKIVVIVVFAKIVGFAIIVEEIQRIGVRPRYV